MATTRPKEAIYFNFIRLKSQSNYPSCCGWCSGPAPSVYENLFPTHIAEDTKIEISYRVNVFLKWACEQHQTEFLFYAYRVAHLVGQLIED